MNPALTAFLLAAACGFLAFTLYRRLAPLAALRRDARFEQVGERVKGLLRFDFGQTRVLDREEIVPGLLHAALFFAFLVLTIRSLTLFGMGFDPRS